MTEIMLVVTFLVGQVGSEQVPVTRYTTGFRDMSECTAVKADAFPLGQSTIYGLIVITGCVPVINKNSAETVIRMVQPKCGEPIKQKNVHCAWGREPL